LSRNCKSCGVKGSIWWGSVSSGGAPGLGRRR
jgi:hypothetical protein